MNVIRTAVWVSAAALLVAGESQSPLRTAGPLVSNAQVLNRAALRNDKTQPSDREWSDVLQWMKQHSPNRLQFFQSQVSNKTQLLQAKQLIWNEYRLLQEVKYPPLKEVLVSQAEAQDEVFGAQIALRAAQQSHNAEQQDAARDQLKKAVERLVHGEEDVVATRIEKLQRDLDRLKDNHDRRIKQIYHQKLQQITGLVTQNADRAPTEEDHNQE